MHICTSRMAFLSITDGQVGKPYISCICLYTTTQDTRMFPTRLNAQYVTGTKMAGYKDKNASCLTDDVYYALG